MSKRLLLSATLEQEAPHWNRKRHTGTGSRNRSTGNTVVDVSAESTAKLNKIHVCTMRERP
ncbi:MAG: hypothetical protein CMM01_06735 [Rhodopirellula sp.]|nr:hypothetical protein [Rhodopirellula sp.]